MIKRKKVFFVCLVIAIIFTVFSSTIAFSAIQSSAKSTYKITKGKLVNSKTKKVVKGYKIYKKKLYYNGKLKKGYKTYNNHLYRNGKVYTGIYHYKLYVTGKKASKTTLYKGKLYKKGGKLSNGYVVYKNKLYKNGVPNKGYYVYKNKLYKNGVLNKGYYVYKNKLYKNGVLNKGYYVYKNKELYYNSSLKKGQKTYSGFQFNNGKLFNGSFNGVEYKDGKIFTTAVPFVPRSESTNTVEPTDAVKEVDQSAVLSATDSSVQLKKENAKKLKKGDIFFLPATDTAPFGQAREIESKIDTGNEVTVNTVEPELSEIIDQIDLSQQLPVSGDGFIINPELIDHPSSKKLQTQSISKIKLISYGDKGFKLNFNDLEIRNLGTKISGTLELMEPKVNLDIKPINVLGITHDYEFNRMEFIANEKLDIDLSASLSGEKSQKVLLGYIPVPYAGFPHAGIFLGVYLNINASGDIGLYYGFVQTSKIDIGVVNNKKKDKLEPIKEVNSNMDSKGVRIEGKVKFSPGLETGIYFLIGDKDLMSLSAGVDLNSSFQGKTVNFNTDQLSPNACYRLDVTLDAIGKFTFGSAIDTKWFGKIGLEYERELFKKNLLKKDPLANCSYKSIQLVPDKKEFVPGDQFKLALKGTTFDSKGSLENLVIPNNYVTFSSSNKDLVHVSEKGEVTISPNMKSEDKVKLQATYKDPITDESVSSTIPINLSKEFYVSKDLQYSILLDSNIKKQLDIVEKVNHKYMIPSTYFYYKSQALNDNWYLGSITRYTKAQWESFSKSCNDCSKVKETEHWVYVKSFSDDSDETSSKEYQKILDSLANMDIKVSPTDIPQEDDEDKMKYMVDTVGSNLESIIHSGWDFNGTDYVRGKFSNIEPKLEKVATKDYIQSTLKSYFKDSCMACDTGFFPHSVATDVLFNTLDSSDDQLIIETASLKNFINSPGEYLIYTFKKVNNLWLLDDLDWELFDETGLELTVDQAKQQIKNYYIDGIYSSNQVEIEFNDSDWEEEYNDYLEEYQILEYYLFDVNTDGYEFQVKFYPANGLFYQLN